MDKITPYIVGLTLGLILGYGFAVLTSKPTAVALTSRNYFDGTVLFDDGSFWLIRQGE